MSIDDNTTNESENPTPTPTEESNQTSAPESNSSEPPSNSNSNSSAEEKLAAAQNIAGGLIASAMQLKESNPKVFFGGIGAVVLLLIMMMSGGSDSNLPRHKSAAIAVGQKYVLKSANAYDAEATIRLVAVPGSMAAYDDTEEADRIGGCKHMPQNTPVRAIQTQDAYGKKDVFVEVEMLTGECEGSRGWALAIDLQQP